MENDKNTRQMGDSNEERDQDEGSMNNGTIGSDMQVSDSTNDEGKANTSKELNEGVTGKVRGEDSDKATKNS